MARWHTDREELVKWRDLCASSLNSWHYYNSQIRALDALYDLLERGFISESFYRTALLEISQINTGDDVAFYTGLT